MTAPVAPLARPTLSTEPSGQRASGRWRRVCWPYYLAAVVLLLVAAFLRFYDLDGSRMPDVEYEAATAAVGTFPEFWEKLREDSVPPVHPLALWVLYQGERSKFSVRAVSAVAGVLTIAVLLLLLPRVGVEKRVALLAGLLATISTPALAHARRAEEYSLDALLAALLMAGLLLYLRSGRKTLLGLGLFLGPLVQYGLALFGAAVLATAAVAAVHGRGREGSSDSSPGDKRTAYQARTGNWLKQRRDLLGPAAALLAGCAAAWWLTLRHQWVPGGWGSQGYIYGPGYLKPYYFDWAEGPVGFFVVSRIWDLLAWHLTPLAAAWVVIGLGIMAGAAVSRRRFNPILILTLCALGIGVVFALLRWYPLGGTPQTVYLGPLIFLAAGTAFCGVSDKMAVWTGREWLRPAVLVGLALLSVLTGITAAREYQLFALRSLDTALYAQKEDEGEAFYAGLRARVQDGDALYAAPYAHLRTTFHLGDNPAHHRHWQCVSDTVGECLEETVNLTLRDAATARRIWFDPRWGTFEQWRVLQQWEDLGIVERVPIYGERVAWLMADLDWLREKYAVWQQEYRDRTAGAPAAGSNFDLYLEDDVLYYYKEGCRAADIRGSFFLNLVPFKAADLPAEIQPVGYEQLSFAFSQRGALFEGKCFAAVPLPDYDYPLAEIQAGQYVDAGGPAWAVSIDRKPDYFRSLEPAITAVEPAAQGVFDLYLTADALYYYKERCAPGDTARRFFLHIFPAEAADLPAERRRHGFDNRDFDFDRQGAAFDGKCMAEVGRPDYPIAAIRTGQFAIGGSRAWSVEWTVGE